LLVTGKTRGAGRGVGGFADESESGEQREKGRAEEQVKGEKLATALGHYSVTDQWGKKGAGG